MGFQTKQILEGCGIGLLAGLVIGYSDADWLRLAIVLALIGLAARTFAVETKEATFATRVASIGLSAFFAVFLGLYLHGSELFEASPKDKVSSWMAAGYTKEQAKAMVVRGIELPQESHAEQIESVSETLPVLYAPDSTQNFRDSLGRRVDSLQAMISELMAGGGIAHAGTVVSNVAKNLFSSETEQSFCATYDRDAFGSDSAFVNALFVFQNGVLKPCFQDLDEKLRTGAAKRIAAYICDMEIAPSAAWLSAFDPESHSYDADLMLAGLRNLDGAAAPNLGEWIDNQITKKDEFLVTLHSCLSAVKF